MTRIRVAIWRTTSAVRALCLGFVRRLRRFPSARRLLWFVPSGKKRVVRRIIDVTTGNLERWLLGRLVAMLFVGVTSGIAFVVLHVPLAFPLAVLAGLLTFVEYIGAFASAGPPILLALSQSPTRALWVAIVFAALHVVEGYVLTPLLAKTAVRFPPATTLASQAILSALLGPLGLTFATPLMPQRECRSHSSHLARRV